MPSTYSSSLRLELMAQGENANTWGNKTNTNLDKIEQALTGYHTVSVSAADTYILSVVDGSATNLSPGRNAFIKIVGAATSAKTVQVPDAPRGYWVKASAAASITFRSSAGTGFTLPPNQWIFAIANDTTVVNTLSRTGVTSASYGTSSSIPRITVDAFGRITSVTEVSITSGLSATTGVTNTLVGVGAGTSTSVSAANVYMGRDAGLSDTFGSENVAIGFHALRQCGTPLGNIAIGYKAMVSVTSVPTYNIAIGGETLPNISSGYNVALGYWALRNATTALGNVAVGANAQTNRKTGDSNVAIGMSAMVLSSVGSENVAVGGGALYSTQGSRNIGVGYLAAYGLERGNDNIYVGISGVVTSVSATNSIVIGASLTPVTNQVVIGSGAGRISNSFTVNATWTQTSDGTMKDVVGEETLGLDFISKLRPVRFRWKPRNLLPQNHPYYSAENTIDSTRVIHGFVAQDVKAALDSVGCNTFDGWSQDSTGVQAISREMFISPLVKAIQELHKQVQDLRQEIQILRGQR